MKKVGRPPKKGLNNIIKVSVNEEAAEALEETAKYVGKSKSDLLREIIPTVSSKDFEKMISDTSLELLEKHSIDCWELIHTSGCLFEVDKLSERMPAFIITMRTPMVYVKYPTFKVQIYNGKDPHKSTDQKELQDLLSDIKYVSDVCATKADYLIINGNFEQMEFPFVNEVMCLNINLEACKETKDLIVTRLKDNGYDYSVYPTFCIRGDYIELIEDNKYFRVYHPS